MARPFVAGDPLVVRPLRNERVGLGQAARRLADRMSFFEPLPPPLQPPERRWSPDTWKRPSEGTVPATVAVDALLHQDEAFVVTLPHLDVFPNGFRINLLILVNPDRVQDIEARIHPGSMNMPRIGVRFPDGRIGGRVGMRGRSDIPTDEQGLPTQPFVGSPAGGGGIGGWRFSAWVSPLPPDGPLAIFVALPSPATPELFTVVEGSTVRAAADRARVIWT